MSSLTDMSGIQEPTIIGSRSNECHFPLTDEHEHVHVHM